MELFVIFFKQLISLMKQTKGVSII